VYGLQAMSLDIQLVLIVPVGCLDLEVDMDGAQAAGEVRGLAGTLAELKPIVEADAAAHAVSRVLLSALQLGEELGLGQVASLHVGPILHSSCGARQQVSIGRLWREA